MNSNNERARQIIESLINKAKNIPLTSNVPFDDEQMEALEYLNNVCVEHVLGIPEVARDPRKIMYKSNEELKFALTGICLSQALANPLRKRGENKEFFMDNIYVEVVDNQEKYISFGNVSPENVQEAISLDIVQDWEIFRDDEGYGIISLINEKTNLNGLDNYKSGGDILYEFARFQRKYTEKERAKEERARESAQNAFRNAMVQSLAQEVTKQQLLEGKNPMEILDLLFAPTKNTREIRRLSKQKADPSIENRIKDLLLEDKSEADND